MAVPASIQYRDLNQWIEMHRVVTTPSSDTTTNLWGRVYPTSDSVAELVIYNGWELDRFTTTDWQLWYIVWAGYTWLFSAFDIIADGKLLKIRLSTTSSLSTPSLDDLEEYDSDALAAADGVALGGFYLAGPEHDRADYGGVTTRLE